MGLMDDLRAYNEERGTVDPNVSALRGRIGPGQFGGNRQVLADMARTQNYGTQGAIPSFNPLGPNTAPSGVSGVGGGQAKALAELQDLQSRGYGTGSSEDDGFSWGAVGRGAMKGLDWIDTPRAAVVSTLKELGDITGLKGGDGSWDWGDWYQNSADNMGAGELAEQVIGEDALPGWLQATVGFAGDVLLDPLSWTGAGTLAKAAGSGRKVGGKLAAKEIGSAVIDQELRQGGRAAISGAIGRTAAAKQIAGELTEAEMKAITNWQRIGGSKGKALLRRSEREAAGMTDELMGKLGINSKLGVTIGTRNKRVNIPGTERLASGMEAVKGATKMAVAGSRPATAGRKAFTSSNDIWGALYREAMTEVLTNAENAPQAAMALVHINEAKSMAEFWADKEIKGLSTKFSWLGDSVGRTKKARAGALSADEGRQLLGLVESGAHKGVKPPGVSDELFAHAQELGQWFDDQYKFLTENGVNISQRQNYIPHIATKEWMEYEAKGGEFSDSFRKVSGQPKDEGFTMTRQLEEGDDWFGHTLSQSDLTVQRLNDIAEARTPNKMRPLEERPAVVLEKYIESAKNQLLKDNLKQRNWNSGFVGSKKKVLNDVEQAAQHVKSVAAASKVRAAALDTVIVGLRDGLKAARAVAKKVVKEGQDYEAKVLRYQSRANKLQAELDSLESAYNVLKPLDPRKAKASVTAKIKRVEAEIVEKQEALVAAQKKLNAARSSKTREEWTAKRDAAEQTVQKLESDLAANQVTRESLNKFIPGTDTPLPTRAGSTAVIRSAEQAEKQGTDVLTKISKNEAEQFAILGLPDGTPSTLQYWTRDAGSIGKDLNDAGLKAMEAERDLALAAESVKANAKTKVKAGDVDEVSARNELLEQQIGAVQDALLRQGAEYDPVRHALLSQEAQALAYDANTAMLKQSAQEIRDGVQSALDNPAFQDRIMLEVEAGFRELDEATQGLPFYEEAMRKVPDIRVASERKALKKAIKGYDRGMNVWKSWATASPGFVVRNFYSGAFNMYLDGVDPNNFRKMQGFLKEYEGYALTSKGGRGTGGIDEARKWAKRKGYSDQEITYFEQALEAAAGSGWGLTPQEVGKQIGSATRPGMRQKLNPFNEEFGLSSTIRGLSSAAEARMRAGHAFDVLVKGGDVPSAVARLEKYHFNYRDISELDRVMKRVMPFWTFYSRNMALQTNVWTRMPQKLNRSYYNFKRNMEAQSQQEGVVPRYFATNGAVRLPFGDADSGNQWYATPDLPSLRYLKDVGDLKNLEQLISGTTPPLKIATQLIAGKNMFTGAPYKDRLYDYDTEGQMYGRQAPVLLNIPGIRNITSPLIAGAGEAAGVLPGLGFLAEGLESERGRLLMSDRAQAVLDDIAPLAGRVGKLVPNNPKDRSRVVDRWLQFAGVPGKQNTDEMIAGENYRKSLDLQEEMKKIEAQARIRGMKL